MQATAVLWKQKKANLCAVAYFFDIMCAVAYYVGGDIVLS
jgi:hypothetical protein